MLTLHDHLAPDVRDKYAEEYARKLSPRYRLRKASHALAHAKPRSVLDARGFQLVWTERRRGAVVTLRKWLFAGWQDDPIQAHAFAEFILTNKNFSKGPLNCDDHSARQTLAELVRATPHHRAINAANPPHETHDCEHDLNEHDTCKHCGEDFATHLALKGAGLL